MAKQIPRDPNTSDPREAALAVLVHFGEADTDADRLLHDLLARGGIEGADARLATELTLGVLRRRSQLDEMLKPLTRGPFHKTPRVLRELLRLGAYQIVHLDRVPDHAAVNESVELAKRWAPNGAGMVNAILRRIVERKPALEAEAQTLPPRSEWPRHFSHPAWLVDYLAAHYPESEVAALLEWNNRPPSITLRANPMKTTPEQLAEGLAANGCKIGRVGDPAPSAVEVLSGLGDPGRANWMTAGLATVQDAAAQLVGLLVDPKPNERIVDWCAAPGGKSTHLAELAEDRARILALDIDAERLAQVEGHARRLGLQSIPTHLLRPELIDWLAANRADTVLVDAPCTGLGTLQRHPDIRWRRRKEDVERAARLQLEILGAAARAVAPGGRLIYSTCTIGPVENEEVIEAFLARHRKFRRIDPSRPVHPAVAPYLNEAGDLHTWPPAHRTDGFYAARLVRSGESGNA